MISTTKKFSFFMTLITLFCFCLYNPIISDDYVVCSDMFKAKDYAFCPTIMSCPDPLLRINLYTCAYDRSFATISKCKTGLECWHGECVNNEDEKITKCPSHISCPTKDNTIKCPDNTCVENIKDCPKYVECPSFNPIRCGNGDCRKSLSDCPSLVHCPDNYPVMCNDGSCRSSKSQCVFPTDETTCDDKSITRCSDGTCQNSKFLCPTLTTCPLGYERCWDGNCRLQGSCFQTSDNTEIKGVVCSDSQVLCQFDYTCASDINSCPTGIICPIDKPVKCWDNSCRDSIENCPVFQNCPSGLIECPDGSCGLKTCGTHITCSVEAPYRCFDNTCRRNPEDCPPQPSCPSETPILCWDGRCLAERGECLAPSFCGNGDNKVKCPNGLCAKSSTNCKEEFNCPSEFVKCKDGTCRKKLADCPKEICPLNIPFKCKNGLCVSDEKYCDKDNGCPFYLPLKCEDGSCTDSLDNCPLVAVCSDGKRRCPDGSCLPKGVVCPSEMGCPQDSPFRCANGECINPKKNTCSIPVCDSTMPIKCFDGTCVLTKNYCPIERKIDQVSGNVICADGTQAHSYDECKPLVKCGLGQVRCKDGTCRSSEEECPYGNTCPRGEIRCENGNCAKNKLSCPSENGCTLEKPYKCPGNGYCVKDLDLCEKLENEYDEANGCPKDKPVKCPLKKNCVVDEVDCTDVESSCPSGYFMCQDGFCTNNVEDCNNDEHIKNCGEYEGLENKKVQCLNEPDWCANTVGDCYNTINCKVDTPFRCTNGECKRYPSKNAGSNGCDIGIACPNYKPYLCADGSCAEKSSFCKSYTGCPDDKPYLCSDKTCVASKDECGNNHQKCPANNPMLCLNGNCGSGIYDCNESKCPSWTPYYCILGNCAKTPRDCQNIEYDPKTYTKKIGSVCNSNEYICHDGTCREKPEDCPIYSGCVSNDASFKCLDGGCAEDKESCNKNNAIAFFGCPNKTTLCEDGICRENCKFVEFNGCPNESPLLCSNGRCVREKIECVGESACESTEKPFRCIDGSCGASFKDCKIPFREVGTTNVLISVYPKMEIVADLVIGPNNILSGKVEIPADTLINKNDRSPAETQVNFRSVSRNIIGDTYSIYDETRVDDLKSIYPYSDPDGNYTLTYQYTVLSTAVEITLKNKENIQFMGNILLTLLFDFPYKNKMLEKSNVSEDNKETYEKTTRYTTLPLSYSKDVCLAKLNVNTRKWECNNKNFNVEAKNNLQLTGELNEEGIYAVILGLRRNNNKLYIYKNWFLAHIKLLSILFLILLVILGVIVYVFIRVYRYRQKYKGTKDIYKGFELEINDLQDKSVSGRQGQTFGDVKEGIIYTDNIAFKSQIDKDARNKNSQLEKIFDAYTKKLRLLERNNALLKGQYDSIRNEYARLNNYKDNQKEGEQVQLPINNQNSSENQIIDSINDDDKE